MFQHRHTFYTPPTPAPEPLLLDPPPHVAAIDGGGLAAKYLMRGPEGEGLQLGKITARGGGSEGFRLDRSEAVKGSEYPSAFSPRFARPVAVIHDSPELGSVDGRRG